MRFIPEYSNTWHDIYCQLKPFNPSQESSTNRKREIQGLQGQFISSLFLSFGIFQLNYIQMQRIS